MTKTLWSFLSTRRIAALVIAVASILAVASVWNDSLIVDEDPHIGAGYSYVVKGDMRLNPEHPPLAKDLAAIPLLFLNLTQDAFQSKAWLADLNGQWDFGRALIYNSGNDADLIGHAAKIPMLLFFIGSAIFIFLWTRKLWGDRAALAALTLFAFSPTVMAHARFVTTDMAALFGVLSATYFFVQYLQQPTKRNFWLASVFFGIALVTKFSTILLVPFFLILAVLYVLPNLCSTLYALRSTTLVMIVGFALVVWPLYFFHTRNYPPDRQRADTTALLQSFGNRALAEPVVWLSDKPILRAAGHYGLGLLMVTQRSSGGNTVYFRGNVTNAAGPGYFPFVYLIKEPIPWLILLGIAILALAKFLIFNFKFSINFQFSIFKNHFPEIAMLLWLVIYWATSIQSSLNIGVRHLLPTYPFAIMLVSGGAVGIIKNAKIKMKNDNVKSKILNFKLQFYILIFTFYILLGWYVVENVKTYPYYLTYFNQFAGGPSKGYRYVVDSNLDWGQDLKRFARWVEENDIEKIELDYFGWADQAYYLGDRFLWLTADKYKSEQDFRTRNTSDGWIAVSATFLMNNYHTKYAWLYAHDPVTVIGNSIFVYQIK